MPDLDLNERELAAGAAIAMDMAREDQRDNQRDRAASPSGAAAAMTIGFVVVASVGMLAIMMLFSG